MSSIKYCSNCAADVVPGAKFCHRCGVKHAEHLKNCPACEQSNPVVSVFCHHCGFHFEGKKTKTPLYQSIYPLDFDPETITEQVMALFFRQLRQRVNDEQDPARHSDYVDRVYHTDFHKIYNIRCDQIAEDALILWEKRGGAPALPEIDRRIGSAFEGLLDYFFVKFCHDINKIRLPESILKYEKMEPNTTDVAQMIRDFLDFEHEPEVVDFDFLKMEAHRLANACKSFLTADRRERVYFICDLSLLGNCKAGFSMTDRGFYWRAPFGSACKTFYSDIRNLRKERDWLIVDGQFFTANPSLNLKMFKLLKKMKELAVPKF